MKKWVNILLVIFTVTIFFNNAIVAQQKYTPVDAGSKINFVIKNFGVKTDGDFSGLKGVIIFDINNLATSSFNVTINTNTINTDNSLRDDHLRKPEFFDVVKYPTISLVSTKIAKTKKQGLFIVYGNLTIKGVVKHIEFPFAVSSINNGYMFKGSFDINRKDFGVGGSSFSISDNLTVFLNILSQKIN